MKKHLIYLAALVMGLSAVSCEDFLTVQSRSSVPEDDLFATEGDAYRTILGIYAVLSHNNIYTKQVSTYFPYNNDCEFAITSQAEEDNRRGLWDYTATSGNSELQAYQYMYIAINRVNECISGIEKSDLFKNSSPDVPSNIRHMYGEAKAIRALMYLELTRNWGDVPFKDRETRADDDFYIGATNRDTIMTRMIRDLIEVEPAMFYASEITQGIERVNRGAVQGLIARMALTRGGWSLRPNLNNPADLGYMYRPDDYLKYYQIANDYARKLIESGKHGLNSTFKQVFLNECQKICPSNDDMLFEIPMALNYTSAIGHNIGVQIATNTQSPYGYSNVWYYANLPYMHSFNANDTRRDVTCTPYEWYWNDETARLEQRMVATNRVTFGKWSKLEMKTPQGVGAQYNTGINWPIIRYADVLLMLAETENELHGAPTDSARMALKEVRKRAFPEANHQTMVEEYVNNLTGHDDFFEALASERSWEFGGEGIRKYDLIRWNLLRTNIIKMKEKMVQIGIDSRAGTGTYGNYPAYLFYKKLSDGTLDIQGRDSNISPEGKAPAGYQSHGWCRTLVKSDTDHTINENYDRYYRPYVLEKDPMVYLYPFHRDVIAESKGKLKNYYGKY